MFSIRLLKWACITECSGLWVSWITSANKLLELVNYIVMNLYIFILISKLFITLKVEWLYVGICFTYKWLKGATFTNMIPNYNRVTNVFFVHIIVPVLQLRGEKTRWKAQKEENYLSLVSSLQWHQWQGFTLIWNVNRKGRDSDAVCWALRYLDPGR